MEVNHVEVSLSKGVRQISATDYVYPIMQYLLHSTYSYVHTQIISNTSVHMYIHMYVHMDHMDHA